METSGISVGYAAPSSTQSIAEKSTAFSKPAEKIAPQAESNQTASPKKEEVEKAVAALNDFVNPLSTALSFAVDDDSGKTVVKILDQTTQQVIRQIPSKEALEIASALDKFKGLLIQQKA